MPQKARPLLTEEEFEHLAKNGTRDQLVSELRKFVKAKAGRKRVYDSGKDRAAAHRQKQKEELERLRAAQDKQSPK